MDPITTGADSLAETEDVGKKKTGKGDMLWVRVKPGQQFQTRYRAGRQWSQQYKSVAKKELPDNGEADLRRDPYLQVMDKDPLGKRG